MLWHTIQYATNIERGLQGDKQGALGYLQQSASLAKQQGDENSYREVINMIRMIQ